MKHLTHNYLTSSLSYDPSTGHFVRRATGKRVGTPDKNGYVEIELGGKRWFAHRLAWMYVNKEMPPVSLDHINRIKTDNRIENLRYLTPSQQCQNTNTNGLNTSGYKGVSWDSAHQQWRARIRLNDTKYHLGYFDDPLEAFNMYVGAAAILHSHNPVNL